MCSGCARASISMLDALVSWNICKRLHRCRSRTCIARILNLDFDVPKTAANQQSARDSGVWRILWPKIERMMAPAWPESKRLKHFYYLMMYISCELCSRINNNNFDWIPSELFSGSMPSSSMFDTLRTLHISIWWKGSLCNFLNNCKWTWALFTLLQARSNPLATPHALTSTKWKINE